MPYSKNITYSRPNGNQLFVTVQNIKTCRIRVNWFTPQPEKEVSEAVDNE